MSENPTPRLGRAVRYFAPVAVVAVLAVPSAALAGQGNGHGKDSAPGQNKVASNGLGNAGPDNGKEHGGGNASDGPDRNNGNDKPKANGNGHGHAHEGQGRGNAGPDNGKEHGRGNDGDGPDRNNGGGNDKPKTDKPGKPDKSDKPGKSQDAPGQVAATGTAGAGASQVVSMTMPSRAPIACASRRTITITIGRTSDIRRGSVRVNGKKVVTRVRRGKVVTTIDLRMLAKGTYTIRTRAVMSDGDVKTGTRRYRTCTPKQRAAQKAASRKAAQKRAARRKASRS